MKIGKKKILVLALAVTFLGASISSLAEEVESRKLSIMQVDGNEAYVIRGNERKITAAAGMNLGQGNQVQTGKASSIYIEADDDKTLKLDSNSLIEISKASSKSLKLTLQNGKLFFNVEKPLASDEEMQFEAANTSMSIRGTSGVFIMGEETLKFYLIDGTVEWVLDNGQLISISGGQMVELQRDWGDSQPGPGIEKKYILKHTGSFHWTDLDGAGLAAVLENRDKLDLTLIGLDSPEEIAKAEERVKEYEKEKEAESAKGDIIEYDPDDYDDRDRYVPRETSPADPTDPTEPETSVATPNEPEETEPEETEPETEPGGAYFFSYDESDTSTIVWVTYKDGENGTYDENGTWEWDDGKLPSNYEPAGGELWVKDTITWEGTVPSGETKWVEYTKENGYVNTEGEWVWDESFLTTEGYTDDPRSLLATSLQATP